MMYLHAGRFQEMLDTAEAVLELTTDKPELNASFLLESPRGLALQLKSVGLALRGRSSEAVAQLSAAEEFLRDREYRETLAWQACFRFFVLCVAGAEMGQGEVRNAREAYEIAEAIGGPLAKLSTLMPLSAACLDTGMLADAMAAANNALALIESTGSGRDFEPFLRQQRSRVSTAAGEHEQGILQAEQGIRCAIQTANRFYEPWSCAAFATAAAAARTELDRALEVLDQAERVVTETGARGFLPELLRARARVHAAKGEYEAELKTLQRGLQIARENHADGWSKRFQQALAAGTNPVIPAGEEPAPAPPVIPARHEPAGPTRRPRRVALHGGSDGKEPAKDLRPPHCSLDGG
jgi:tetratricopeptide (TPR) repeat protein